ncbi:MAG TPA: phosphonopyruvate decarboxylase [Burkholderiales bacterium]|nr:phosphonopyruvate decarboxylase [Burkholderiales bacterium]
MPLNKKDAERLLEGWPQEVHRELAAARVRIVGYVPDAGHKRLIELCQHDRKMHAVVLTTEEEGIGLAAGAWLGGQKSALLMQSSGVGNVINAAGMLKTCRIPLVMIVTMRGEEGEFNSWQVPMGRATPGVLEAMGVSVRRAARAEDVAPLVAEALKQDQATAVLVSQRVIGIKSFQEQANQ